LNQCNEVEPPLQWSMCSIFIFMTLKL
jgi:hypothetical protein